MTTAWLQVLRGLKANAILTGNMPPSQHQRWKLSASKPAVGSVHAIEAGAASKQRGGAGAGAGALSGQRLHRNANAASGGSLKGHTTSDSSHPDKEGSVETAKKQPAQGSTAVGPSKLVTPDCIGSAKVSEVERRARKRLKKQRQKQAAQTDPAKKDREKEKRARRKSARKAKPPESASAAHETIH